MATRVAWIMPGGNARFEKALTDAAKPDVELVPVDAGLPDAEKLKLCRDCEIALVAGRLSNEMVKGWPKLRFIQMMSAGFDGIDPKFIQERGVVIANNSAAIAPSVAEHAITLMLAVKRRLIESWKSVQDRKWVASVNRDGFTEIGESTIGIIGLGNIGSRVAQRLKPWGCTLLYHDVVSFSAAREKELGVKRVSLDELLRTSDIVTVHVPLNSRTRHRIGERELGLMKPSAFLVNTCRGPVVDEAALYKVLKEKRIAGAGLDVLEEEPAPAKNPVLDLDNVLVTPHVAGTSVGRVRRAADFAIENVVRFASGKKPESLIVIQD
ncbi:MAG: NAD(P)-dependent oxidoreductase [Chloroflexota bacterium]|nr:NAD(P)-dependent oxidoreductase [Chloroflexota bacterium]